MTQYLVLVLGDSLGWDSPAIDAFNPASTGTPYCGAL